MKAVTTALAALSLLLGVATYTGATAQDLRIAVESGPTSNDPHFHALVPNIAFHRHIFEPLMAQDARQVLRPALAVSWTALDDVTWEIKLRPNVLWHDGSPFTADDVLFTLARAGTVPNSPSSFRIYVQSVVKAEAVDPLTVRLTTAVPTPLLPNNLSLVLIVSRRHGEGATTADYNSGKAMVGTGPYRYTSWTPNEALRLQRNSSYWGEAPEFADVEFRRIAAAQARVAALLARDVDVIEFPSTADFERLKSNPQITTVESVSNRLIFLHLDSARAASPFVTGPNVLRDARVRRALSLAINRAALVERVMERQALVAGDLGPPGYFGTDPALTPDPFDPDAARRLLADAGLPTGFSLTLHGPNDRYVNDERVLQAIAQMWVRIGVQTRVEAVPRATYFTRATRTEFSAMLLGFSPNPETLGMLEPLIATYDAATGMGSANRGRYSNPAVDALIQQARTTVDNAARERLTQAATRAALADTAIIPLYFQYNTWAVRRGLSYEARTDEMTLATSVRRAQ